MSLRSSSSVNSDSSILSSSSSGVSVLVKKVGSDLKLNEFPAGLLSPYTACSFATIEPYSIELMVTLINLSSFGGIQAALSSLYPLTSVGYSIFYVLSLLRHFSNSAK